MKHNFTLPNNAKFYSQTDYQNAYVSEFLTDQLKAYDNKAENYIWTKLFPVRPVKKPKGKLTSLGFQSMKLMETKRSARGSANHVEFGVVNTDEYSVEQHALFADVMTWDIENADSPLDAKRDYTFMLKGIMDLSKENAAISQAFDSTVMSGYTASLSGTTRFDY